MLVGVRGIGWCAAVAALIAAVGLSVLVGSAPRSHADGSSGCTRFASPKGSDRNPGTRDRPFRTAQRLASSLKPGRTGCLRAGRYRAKEGDYVLRFRRAGRVDAPIVIRSYPGERATLVGIVIVPASADHVQLANVRVEGSGSQNTIKIYASDVVIQRSVITNRLRGQSCMLLGSTDGGDAIRPLIRRNFFHDCGALANDNKDHGIYVAHADDGRIEDNVFVNSAAKTIQLYPDAQRTHVAHNIIDGGPDTVRGGIVIGGDDDDASSGNIVEQNIISHAATYNLYSNFDGPVGSANIVRNNCMWGAGQGDIDDEGGLVVESNVSANPRFRNRADRDYRLRPGSPCRSVVGYDTAALLRRHGLPPG